MDRRGAIKCTEHGQCVFQLPATLSASNATENGKAARGAKTSSKPPFTNLGVDCFGPFTVRRGRTTAKRYGVLFTCLAIRAVHIDVVYSLDTESFTEALQACSQAQIDEYLLQHDVNPPAASHNGGVWERCIRTARKVMKALLKQQVLDDEALNTLMCEVESIVNGRPITKVSANPRDLNTLTPNHLLLLRAGTAILPGVFSKKDNYTCHRRRQVQYHSNIFWSHRTREYLPFYSRLQR